MFLYYSGDDCQGAFSYVTLAKSSDKSGNALEGEIPDFNITVNNYSKPRILEGDRMLWFGSSDNGNKEVNKTKHNLTEIIGYFDPVEDLSHFFNKTISLLTDNYIKRYFRRMCKLGYSENSTVEVSAKYSKFCELYKNNNCPDDPDQKVCIKASLMWYEDLNVVGVCYKTWANMISLSNRIEKADRVELIDQLFPYFYIAIFCCLVVFTIGFEYWHEVFSRKLDSIQATIGDYTILLDKLPCGKNFKNYKARDNIASMMTQNGYFIKTINFVFDVSEYVELKKKLSDLIAKKYKKKYTQKETSDLEKFNESQVLLEEEEKQIKILEQKIEIWEKRFEREEVEFMIGKAYVCFNRGEHRDHCFKKFKRSGFLYEWFGVGAKTQDDLMLNVFGQEKKLHVFLPEEPGDILWDNLGGGNTSRTLRRWFAVFIGIVIVVCGMIGLYYLKTEKVFFFNLFLKIKFVNYFFRKLKHRNPK